MWWVTWVASGSSVSSARCVVVLIDPQTIDNEGRQYECDLLPLMEVGSVAHKYYLLNIRLPVNERKKINVGIGEIKDIQVVVSKPQSCANTFLQKIIIFVHSLTVSVSPRASIRTAASPKCGLPWRRSSRPASSSSWSGTGDGSA